MQVEPTFGAGVLHELNYDSITVFVKIYWEQRRVFLNCSLSFVQPKQI